VQLKPADLLVGWLAEEIRSRKEFIIAGWAARLVAEGFDPVHAGRPRRCPSHHAHSSRNVAHKFTATSRGAPAQWRVMPIKS